ncbi:DUF4102 domain-containing protein [Hylemonella gracilis]|uniref:DUF4102 domain-containing protein n=1 Tax=Hylemonella gracilis TaxID=80880 RepID=A0A4P6UQ75_9BURK|nr:integrase family protein [Hylemonella gracilis]QBK06297.1 DUF4102 domain-containing protein [Hylemonella gracilis]
MRPLKNAPVDLTAAQELTVGLIERLTCPEGKSQAFLRDRKAPALRVRVTPSGAKSYVFEAKLGRQTVRRTIGDVRSWTIEGARAEANRLRVQIDQGADPREQERKQEAERRAKAALEAVQVVTMGEAWNAYIESRRSRWGEHHYNDHIRKAKAGGETAIRGTRGRGTTVAGPIYPLLALKMRDLTPSTLSAWAEKETAKAPTSARLSWRLVRGFLSWAAEHPQYGLVLPAQNPAKAKVVREVLGKSKTRSDALQREQLAPWFAAVRQIANPMASAYLQVLLLTGARPGEVLALRWDDIDPKWKGLNIRDKVEGERIIPLTPYVDYLLHALPHVNEWVFASPSHEEKNADKAMSTPHKLHEKACTVAGITGLTLHGLRRSFKSLSEWQEIPAGVVAQIMGHKPSATAEKHYTVRPLDLLRLHHEKIEAWILTQAHIDFDPHASVSRTLRAVK